MRTEEIRIYTFAELSDDAKEKAIEACRDYNIHESWYEFTYEDFKNMCEIFGIDIHEKRRNTPSIYFSGFWSQGDGSSFDADVDILKFIAAVNGEKWKEYAPLAALDFEKYEIHHSVDRAMGYSDAIEIDFTSHAQTRGYYNRYDWTFKTHAANNATPLIDAELERICDQTERNMDELNNWLYRTLEREYEYLTSDEAVIETIEANEYEFTEDGNRY